MTKPKQKYYVVWTGRTPGVYDTWDMCRAQIEAFNGAKYKSFFTRQAAVKAYGEAPEKHIYQKARETVKALLDTGPTMPLADSISVDAACNMHAHIMEYRGVHTASRKELFAQGPFPGATNNIGEFLAVVHALAYCKKNNITLPIYTDSITALSWVRKKKANTLQAQSSINNHVFDLIHRAEEWLHNNTYTNPLLKWDTEHWGEIPADYGRK